jgi:hypothetical protein
MTAGWTIALVAFILLANGLMWGALWVWLRRRWPLPSELTPPEAPDPDAAEFRGYYLETRLLRAGVEAGRFLGWGRLARGAGVLRLEHGGLAFRRFLTRRPRWIPGAAVRGVSLSKRRRIRGEMALHLDWEAGGLRLRSVFVLAGGISVTVLVAQRLQPRLAAREGESRE